jgi:hypothetical protein
LICCGPEVICRIQTPAITKETGRITDVTAMTNDSIRVWLGNPHCLSSVFPSHGLSSVSLSQIVGVVTALRVGVVDCEFLSLSSAGRDQHSAFRQPSQRIADNALRSEFPSVQRPVPKLRKFTRSGIRMEKRKPPHSCFRLREVPPITLLVRDPPPLLVRRILACSGERACRRVKFSGAVIRSSRTRSKRVPASFEALRPASRADLRTSDPRTTLPMSSSRPVIAIEA